MFEYATLKLIWWFIIGCLMIGFAIMDGYDLGVAGLLSIIKKDNHRRVMINTIAPHWDGNQVWFIAMGGCIFAGWPQVYATSFSGFYFALLIILFSLILRPLCLEYRMKVAEHQKKYCDLGLIIGGTLVPILCGAAIGNLFIGFGFSLDHTLRSNFTGTFFDLLNPFAIFCGVLSLCMIWMHGATWLSLRVDNETIHNRVVVFSRIFAIVVIVLFALGGVWLKWIPGYVLTKINENGIADPLNKSVIVQTGAWLNNYSIYPAMIIAPIAGFLGSITVLLTVKHLAWLAFLASSAAVAGIIATAGISLFPFLLPSNTHPISSLTIWDSTSSQATLTLTVGIVSVMICVVTLYNLWCHRKMWRRLSTKIIDNESHKLY